MRIYLTGFFWFNAKNQIKSFLYLKPNFPKEIYYLIFKIITNNYNAVDFTDNKNSNQKSLDDEYEYFEEEEEEYHEGDSCSNETFSEIDLLKHIL